MGKIQDSNTKAHKDRVRDAAVIQPILAEVGIMLEKITDGTIYGSGNVSRYNNIANRYGMRVDKLLGHSFLLYYAGDPDKSRIVEFRYPDRGMYYKAPSGISHIHDLLSEMNVIFFIPHHNKRMRLTNVGILTMDNKRLSRPYWKHSKSKSNSNRWDNNEVSSYLKTTVGYDITSEKGSTLFGDRGAIAFQNQLLQELADA